MKRITIFLLLLLTIFTLSACDEINLPNDNNQDNTNTSIDNLDIYYLNDTHGAILESGDQMGFAKIGNLILTQKNENPDETLFLTGGDILQGNILSNYFSGSSTIDILNDMQLDAFVLGNHEFDWGLETVTQYFIDDSDSEIKANFPLLGANVFYDGSTERPVGVDAYTVIQKGDVKVGIIGVVGEGLESSIANAMVDPYYFADPVYWTEYYANYLRTEEDVDIVIAINHDNSNSYNQSVAALTGDSYVDVIFNGHSHQEYVNSIYRSPETCYVVQSGSSGEFVGHVAFDIEDKVITNVNAKNLDKSNETLLRTANQTIETKIVSYTTEIEPLLNEVIIQSGAYMSSYDLTEYMAKLMTLKVGASIAFHNYGGTRTSIDYQQDITVATLYEIFPFDNVIKTVYLTGSEIKAYINANSDYVGYYQSVSSFDDHTLYLVATNNYVFDKTENPFIYGDDPVDTGILIRDVLETALRNMADSYDYFYLNNSINLD